MNGRKIVKSGLEALTGTAIAIAVPVLSCAHIYAPVLKHIYQVQQDPKAGALFAVTGLFTFGVMPLYLGGKLLSRAYSTLRGN